MRSPFSAPPSFDLTTLQRLADDMAWAGGGEQLSHAQVAALIERWQPVVQPVPKHHELFDLVTRAGQTTGIVAPRWLCHLMGLCHRTVHLVLRTPQDWLALQVRGRRVDWPGRLDLSVTGHVSAGLSWREAVCREAAEELGLDLTAGSCMVTAEGVSEVGPPYRRCEADSFNPPVHICHVTQVFSATLTATGLASLRFADGEVVGLYLCSMAEAERLIEEDGLRVAPGLTQSLPVYRAYAATPS